MANGLLGIGSSALLAYQRTLNTIGHNIANVNTPGYSRQSVELSARAPQAHGFGFSGTGVDTVSIRRSYNAYVESSVRSGTSAAQEYKTFNGLAVQLDNVLADSSAGMNTSIQHFFNAVQDVTNAPSDSASRQVMFSEGKQLANHFNDLAAYIENTRGQLNSTIKGGVNEINQITKNLAKINQSIVVETGRTGGQPPNDLLDQRDQLIRDLSTYVNVITMKQDDGSINVMIGKGQLLVRGSQASSLKTVVKYNDPNQLGISIAGGSGPDIPIGERQLGGQLGGAFNFRNQMLDAASNSLGRVALGIASQFNQQNRRGMDLNGTLGIDMFSVAQPKTLVRQGNASNISVSYNNISQLTNQDYTLRYKSGAWGLTRNDTGQSVAMSGAGTAANPFIADGLKIEINTPPASGDSYIIRPTRKGAQDIQMTLANSSQIATAAPVTSRAANANTGTGKISAGSVSDISNAAFQTTAGKLTPPLLIRFSSAGSYNILDNTNPSSPVMLEANIPYNAATGGDVFPTPGGLDYGYRMRLTGAPAAGDSFSTEYNTGGTGDNRNALLMAGLATAKTLNGGSASFSESYDGMVADVGTGTRQSAVNSQSQQRLLDQSLATRESISGVNLDDEAANLVRFQQAYQAAARVVATANKLFDTLLNAVGR